MIKDVSDEDVRDGSDDASRISIILTCTRHPVITGNDVFFPGRMMET